VELALPSSLLPREGGEDDDEVVLLALAAEAMVEAHP